MKKILNVDDEAKMRNLIQIYPQNAGYSMQEAADGQQALHTLEPSRPHVVVLDIMIPGTGCTSATFCSYVPHTFFTFSF
jgi:DNA-binding response OmpR family regulator